VVLATAGLGLSVGLEALHVRAYLDPAASSFCALGGPLDCDSVALSRASVVLGVPLAIWGIAGFAALLIAAIQRSRLLLPLAAFSAAVSVVLLLQELFEVGSVCLLCEAVHLCAAALAVVAWRRRRSAALPTRRGLAAQLGIPAILVVGTWLFVPPYWVLVSWHSGTRFATGEDELGRPWIGAESPTVTVVEYVDYACPHCAAAASRMRLLVGEHPAEIRLVRHHQPRMRCRLGHQCQYARAAICAGSQGKFWEMDDWLFRHAPGRPTLDLGHAARDVGLDVASLQQCVEAPSTFESAELFGQRARDAGVRATPTYDVEGEQLTLQDALERVRSRL
jgi:uncharacterized membrane protein